MVPDQKAKKFPFSSEERNSIGLSRWPLPFLSSGNDALLFFENRISGNRDTSVDERAPEREARATREDAPRPPVQI